MAEKQKTYVVVALGAFWHGGKLIEPEHVFEATRKERVNLVAAKSVRDANDEEIEAFRADDAPAKTTKAKAATSTEGDAAQLAAKKDDTKAGK